MDEIINSKYAALLATLAAGIGLGGLPQKNTRGSKRLTQRAATGMETAKAASTPAGSSEAKIDPETSSIAGTAQNSAPAAAVPAATKARQANGHKTKAKQVMRLAQTLKVQNQIFLSLLAILTFLNLIPFISAQTSPDHINMFNQIGQMASSMAYIDAAIPLNISTYQHHISLFEITLMHQLQQHSP